MKLKKITRKKKKYKVSRSNLRLGSQDIDNAIESKNKKIQIQSLIHTQTNAKR
jgi:hypothetical protein